MVKTQAAGTKRFVGVGLEDPQLPTSIVESVLGVSIGYTDEGNLVGVQNLGELSEERRHVLGQRLLEMGWALLEGRVQIH